MSRSKILAAVVVMLVLVAALSMAGCSAQEATQPPAQTPPASENSSGDDVAQGGEALVEDKCSGCHATMRIYMPSYANEPAGGMDWADVIGRMKEIHGAVLTDVEVASIVDYLVKRTPTDAEALVKEKCTSCHDTTRIYNAAGDNTQWAEIITRMKEKHGAVLTDEEQATIIGFFQK